LSPRSTAPPLYTSFHKKFSSCSSKVTIGYDPKLAAAAATPLALAIAPAQMLKQERR
jgi:hypothetical protein